MVRRPTRCSALIATGYLFFVLALVSLYQYLNVQDNKCLMTFMYETPNFIPVPMPKKLETNFPKYKIYAYKEGKKDNKFSYSDFNGFPVLFIPGSSGSFKQVRSFASVSMNFFRHYQTRSHLDFFAIDYNEELSGVYGPYLSNQTVFLNQAIKVIKRLYYRKSDDVKLIVIAHSFGGIIFKGLITLPSFKLDDIFLFLSLATPHRNSVFAFDSSFHVYYSQIADRLRTDPVLLEAYESVAKISIGGGLNDNLVRSDLTNVPSDERRNQWSLTSNAIPEVWVAADHKCIVWCKQLVKKLVHLIFDLLEERWNDPRMLARNAIIEHHLNYRFNDRMSPRYRTRTPLHEGKGKVYAIDKRLFVVDRPKVVDQLIYRFALVRDTYFSIVSSSLHRSDWIFACDAQDSCVSAQNYSNSPIPSVNEFNGVKRNHFLLDSNAYLAQNYTRMALKIGASAVRTGFQFERIINGRRDRQIELPGLLSRLLWFFNPFHTLLTVSVGEESTFFNLTLNNFEQIWQNYHLRIEVGRCYPRAREDAVLIVRVPWYREDRLYAFESKRESSFSAVLNLNVPKYDHTDQRKVTLQLLLDPYCEYRLKAKFSLRESIIQLFRHYAFLFLPITTSLLLSAYSIQMRAIISEPPLGLAGRELAPKAEHFSSLRHVLGNHLNELTFFGLQPALPYLIHLTVDGLLRLFGYHDFLESNILSIKYTRHSSHVDSLFASYLIYGFIYCILFIIVHLLSHLLTFIVALNQLIVLNGAHLQFKPQQLSKAAWKTGPFSNPRTLSRFVWIVAFFAAIYLRLIVYALVAVYLFELLMIATQCTLEQRKVGLTKTSTRFHLDLSHFLLIALAFGPLVPKFIVWLTTNQLDQTIVLYKLCFGLSLLQLHFRLEHEVSERRTLQLSYLTKLFALLCLCAAPLDYTVITVGCLLISLLRSAVKLHSALENWRHEQIDVKGAKQANGQPNKFVDGKEFAKELRVENGVEDTEWNGRGRKTDEFTAGLSSGLGSG